MSCFKQANRIVVKVGTSTIAYNTGLINIRRVESLVKVLADLANSGKQVVLVTSGAIGVGCGKLGLHERPKDVPGKQAAAAVGQCELMYLYDNLFSAYNRTVAQVLLTKDVVDSENRKQNVINTFCRLLDLRVIPIINENDTVSIDELEGEQERFGDNDTLSAVVAGLVHADALIILSDIDGLYTDNPRTNPNAKLIPEVTKIDDSIRAMASGAGSSHGTGGMITKINAAEISMNAGIPMAVLSGEDPALLYELLAGGQVGTHFIPTAGQR